MYHQNWPLLGLQYFMYGKLANYMGHVQEAFQNLQKSLRILCILFSFFYGVDYNDDYL